MLDDFEILRQRRAFPRPTPAPPGSGGSAAFVGKVTTATPAVGKFCLVNPVQVTGTEGEGNAGTLAADTGKSIAVYILGPKAPATNDFIVCRNVDYRWVSVQTTPPVTGVACGSQFAWPAANLTLTFRWLNTWEPAGTTPTTLTTAMTWNGATTWQSALVSISDRIVSGHVVSGYQIFNTSSGFYDTWGFHKFSVTCFGTPGVWNFSHQASRNGTFAAGDLQIYTVPMDTGTSTASPFFAYFPNPFYGTSSCPDDVDGTVTP